jgi:hypothetical protein
MIEIIVKKPSLSPTLKWHSFSLAPTTVIWPDYVFKKNYKLRSLTETEKFIAENGHLPEIPAASAIEKNGVSIGEMLTLQMKKIKELTLYIIEQQKKIEKLESELYKNK